MDHVRRTYGLTTDEYKQLLTTQDYRCAICSKFLEIHGPPTARPVVDHCHETQKIRGLLCAPCNSGLGQFQDDMAIAQRAANYLLITQHHNPLDPAHLRMETATATERNNHV